MTIYEFAPARLQESGQRLLRIVVACIIVAILLASFLIFWPTGRALWMQIFLILTSVALASTFVYRVSSIDKLFAFGLTASILAVLGPFNNPVFAASAWTVGVFCGLWVLYKNFFSAAEAALCLWFSAVTLVATWQLTHAALEPVSHITEGFWGLLITHNVPQIVAAIVAFYLVRTVIATIRAMVLTTFSLREILLRVSWQRIFTMLCAEIGVAFAVSVLSTNLNMYIFEDENSYGKTSLIVLTAALAFGLSGRWTVRSVRERLDSLVGATLKLPWPEDQPVRELALEFARLALPKYRVSAYTHLRDTSRDHIRSVPIEADEDSFTLVAMRRANQPPFRVEDQQILVSIAQIANETSRARKEVRTLRRQANTDRLTGLLNYRAFQVALDELSEQHSGDNLVALIFIDIDNFKLINDTHGHEVGNIVLKTIARRIQQTVAEPCMVARVGGDEFVVLLQNLPSMTEAEELQRQLNHAVGRPIEADRAIISLRISQGIAFSTPGQQDLSPLVELADRRMYESRGNLLDTVTEPLHADVSEEPGAVLALREGILQKRLHMVFQPIVSLDTNELTALESLLRYTDPVHGVQPVQLVLNEAQRFGLLSELSMQMLDQSTSGLQRVKQRVPTLNRVHLNIGLEQLLDDDFMRRVEERVEIYSDCELVLEINESSLRDSTPGSVARVAKLAETTSAVLAIDDIGQAYTGLASLRDYPFSVWKVDRGMLQHFENPRTAPIVKSLLTLGEELGVDVIFEGVESEQQHEWLVELGAHFAQGYLYGRPVSLDELLLRFDVAGVSARV